MAGTEGPWTKVNIVFGMCMAVVMAAMAYLGLAVNAHWPPFSPRPTQTQSVPPTS